MKPVVIARDILQQLSYYTTEKIQSQLTRPNHNNAIFSKACHVLRSVNSPSDLLLQNEVSKILQETVSRLFLVNRLFHLRWFRRCYMIIAILFPQGNCSNALLLLATLLSILLEYHATSELTQILHFDCLRYLGTISNSH